MRLFSLNPPCFVMLFGIKARLLTETTRPHGHMSWPLPNPPGCLVWAMLPLPRPAFRSLNTSSLPHPGPAFTPSA